MANEGNNTNPDRTFDPLSEYGSNAFCAAVLGKSTVWFRTNRAALEMDGFPKACKIVGLTVKADVAAWIAKRRRYADTAAKGQAPAKVEDKTRYDRL
jgi:hypothetical protein